MGGKKRGGNGEEYPTDPAKIIGMFPDPQFKEGAEGCPFIRKFRPWREQDIHLVIDDKLLIGISTYNAIEKKPRNKHKEQSKHLRKLPPLAVPHPELAALDPMLYWQNQHLVEERIVRHPRSERGVFAYAGLFRCRGCGAPMTCRSAKEKRADGSTVILKTYYCSSAESGASACPRPDRFSETAANAGMIPAITQVLRWTVRDNLEARAKAGDRLADDRERLAQIDAEMEDFSQQIANLTQLLAKDLSDEDAAAMRNNLRKKRESLKIDRERLLSKRAATDEIVSVMELFDGEDLEDELKCMANDGGPMNDLAAFIFLAVQIDYKAPGLGWAKGLKRGSPRQRGDGRIQTYAFTPEFERFWELNGLDTPPALLNAERVPSSTLTVCPTPGRRSSHKGTRACNRIHMDKVFRFGSRR